MARPDTGLIAEQVPQSFQRGFEHMNQPIGTAARNDGIVSGYLAGKTADAIAIEEGLTSAGIRAILRRRGVTLRPRGRVAADPNKIKRPTRAEAFVSLLAEDGLSIDDFAGKAGAVDALNKFRDQRMRAKQRGIGWSLTFGEWWSIWSKSGQWARRGRDAADSAVMARRGDIGPYSAENVYITTLAKNFTDSHLFRGHRVKGLVSHAAIVFRSL